MDPSMQPKVAELQKLNQQFGQQAFHILELEKTYVKRLQATDTDSYQGQLSVAAIDQDIVYYKERFSKLKFNYLEQATKERFIHDLMQEPPLVVQQEDNHELEAHNAQHKQQLKKRKHEAGVRREQIEYLVETVANDYEHLKQELGQASGLVQTVTTLEQELRELENQGEDHEQKLTIQESQTKLQDQLQKLAVTNADIERAAADLAQQDKEMAELEEEVRRLEKTKMTQDTLATEAVRLAKNKNPRIQYLCQWYNEAIELVGELLGIRALNYIDDQTVRVIYSTKVKSESQPSAEEPGDITTLTDKHYVSMIIRFQEDLDTVKSLEVYGTDKIPTDYYLKLVRSENVELYQLIQNIGKKLLDVTHLPIRLLHQCDLMVYSDSGYSLLTRESTMQLLANQSLTEWARTEAVRLVEAAQSVDYYQLYNDYPGTLTGLAVVLGTMLSYRLFTWVTTDRWVANPTAQVGKYEQPALVSSKLLREVQAQKESPLVFLYQAPDSAKGPSVSLFCLKLETFLRMTRIPYKKVDADFSQCPLGKVPFIAYKGQIVADSSHIIDWLVHDAQLAPDLDKALAPRLVANSLAYKALIEKELGYLMAWEIWTSTEAWPHSRDAIFGGVPGLLRGWVSGMVRAKVINRYDGDGFKGYPESLAWDRVERAMQSLSVLVDRNEYVLGLESPTTLDAVVYAFLIRSLALPNTNPKTSAIVRRFPNLVDYANRISEKYFPDFPSM
ncbi:hypothetical protein IWQ62_000641 [Dispira parvispora]|uniref:Uncharacterized protein n=1 Tax=Dispira parvispora TaxID=1520584 RepID=A0A9W8AU13_9FUNG|nr:hypothetical protein IWQ62_000641 [Dispira parvispora]